MISKNEAFEIAINSLLNQITSNVIYFDYKPNKEWNIYGLSPNCYYLEIRNSISPLIETYNSLVIAIDKETSQVRYFGNISNEG